MYETTEDRYVHEFWAVDLIDFANGSSAPNAAGSITTGASVKGLAPSNIAAYRTLVAGGPFGTGGTKLLPGYGVIYAGTEKNTIAVEDKRTGKWFWDEKAVEIYAALPAVEKAKVPLKLFARYDSEDDFAGDYLGEVEIKMSDYDFQPRPTSLGVTWSQLSELVLDTSFQVSAEEYLVTYASQEIRVALDYRAIKIAYAAAKTNPSGYHVYFDAGYTNGADGVPASKDGYMSNAQTFTSAIDAIGDTMLNDINRGGVSRIVGGPSAASYLKLNAGYSTKGKQSNIGAHQYGELESIPVFKVPSSIIPGDTLLTVSNQTVYKAA
jgi:hypothetical protein